MAAIMKDSLKQLLVRNAIADSVIAEMIDKQCLNVEDFANWVDKREDLKAAFIDNTDQRQVPAQTARIKMAWRQAEAVVQKGLKRTSEGLTEEPLDEPLDEALRVSVIETFSKAWLWPDLPLVRMGTDSLLGRVFREFQARKPTLYPVAKVKSLASVQAKIGGATRRKVGDRVTLCFEGQEDDTMDNVGSVYDYFTLLEILSNTWAVGGAFEVQYQAAVVKYASWPEIYAYNVEIRDEAIGKISDHTESSVLAYVTTVEEEFRIKAIALARSKDQIPWGKALTTVIKEHSSIWDHKADLLAKRKPSYAGVTLREGPSGRQKPQQMGGAAPDSSPIITQMKKEGKDTDWRKNWATGRYDAKNNYICKAWNDTRGCKRNCPKQHAHICDVVLSNGQLCGSSKHNRLGHKISEHGMAKKGR